MPSLSRALFLALLLVFSQHLSAEGVQANISYKSGPGLTDYERDWCKLDLYLPAEQKGFPTLVWFYGGGLTTGSKEGLAKLAAVFNRHGIAFAAVNYRLNPKVTYPAYVEDAAAAFAWVKTHIAEKGGDLARVFLGGHSAGAYLASLVAMDARYLQKFGLTPAAIAGVLPVSGQMMTHFTVRKERGLDANTITSDEAAPIYYTRKVSPPFLIIMGDHDWPARWEENLYFAAAMKAAGNDHVATLQIPDRTHGTIVGKLTEPGDPGAQAMLDFIQASPLPPPSK
ncbi:alpha/beta hydrolase fold domain-containing protein [soil metagenome]